MVQISHQELQYLPPLPHPFIFFPSVQPDATLNDSAAPFPGSGKGSALLFSEKLLTACAWAARIQCITAQWGLESGYTTCVQFTQHFPRQGFHKYLPEVKKESALGTSTQSREPSPKSRERPARAMSP